MTTGMRMMLSMICMELISLETGLPVRLPKERPMVVTRTNGEVEVVAVDEGQGPGAVTGEEEVEEMEIAPCGLTSMDLQLALTTELLWRI